MQIMASAQVPQSDKLAKMVWTTWEKLPFWLPPPQTVLKEREPQWANGGALSIQAGSQDVGIAQGSTPTCLHLSEIGDYKTPRKTIEEGVFPAAHQTDALFFVLEGTGSTVIGMAEREVGLLQVALGPRRKISDRIYPPMLRGRHLPSRRLVEERIRCRKDGRDRRSDETRRMRRRGELFVRSTDYLAEELGRSWEMGREYMWYWQCGYNEAVASHSEKTYLSPECSDGRGRFPVEV